METTTGSPQNVLPNADRPVISFGEALNHLRQSPLMNTAFREGWNGKGQYIALQVPDENSKMGLPYIYISTVEGKLVPWIASQTDMLAEDWVLTRIK